MKRIAISIGDPSGVGPEIIKSWANKHSALFEKCLVIGDKNSLDSLPENVQKIYVGKKTFKAKLGSPSKEGARIAYEALEVAAGLCIDNVCQGVVTAPISKANMKSIGFEFDGHTEFFESKWKGNAVMCFACKKLIVSLVTWHIALSKVSKSITKEKISSAINSANFLAEKLKKTKNPRIAVCGLNPHAGEDSLLGNEEEKLINPSLNSLRKTYKNLSEALPPDTVFMRALKNEFDAIVSMYHDQALAPLKALYFDESVNITMGLEHVRTSPDHGTAFSIAGKGIASDKSFENAVSIAFKLI